MVTENRQRNEQIIIQDNVQGIYGILLLGFFDCLKPVSRWLLIFQNFRAKPIYLFTLFLGVSFPSLPYYWLCSYKWDMNGLRTSSQGDHNNKWKTRTQYKGKSPVFVIQNRGCTRIQYTTVFIGYSHIYQCKTTQLMLLKDLLRM